MSQAAPSKPLIIVGAGQHGRLILDSCLDGQVEVGGLLEDSIVPGTMIYGHRVLGRFDLLSKRDFISSHDFIVGIGGNLLNRKKWTDHIIAYGGTLKTVVHPSAVVSRFSSVGPGCFLKQLSVIFNDSRLGRSVVVDCHSCVGHDVVVGDHVFIAPASQINGGSSIGDDSYIGAGTITVPYARIGRRAMTAAGSIITRHVPDGVLVGGVPATIIRTDTSELLAKPKSILKSL